MLLREPMLVLVKPNHPLVRGTQVSPADLGEETILVTEPGCSYRRMFEQALAAGGQPHAQVEFASVEAIQQCVMVGLGVTLLPQMAVKDELNRGSLVTLPWIGPEFPVATQMCWHKDKWISPALNAFIEITKDTFMLHREELG